MSGQRNAKAVLTANIGGGSRKQEAVLAIESYAFEQSMDVDTDQFSIDVGDPTNRLSYMLDRDTEIQVGIFLENDKMVMVQEFYGFADRVGKDSDDMVLSISGRDFSSVALGDALPGKWRHVKPKGFIEARARKLGFPSTSIPSMREFTTLYTDGSETEWAFWYRMARKRQMFMWTTSVGQLVIGKLGYSLKPSYLFGEGQGYLMPTRVSITKDTSGRIGEEWIYGADSKTNIGFRGHSLDIHIKGWKRLPVRVSTSTTAKSTAEAQDQAHDDIFESIVGAFEIELTFQDTRMLVAQNKIARVNLPFIDLAGDFFVVGVRKQGGMDGMTQVVRLRQKQYALSKRVPTDPKLVSKPDTSVGASVASALQGMKGSTGLRWPDSFVRATREFGVKNGWDQAVFLGVLLAICKHESGFRNVRQGGSYEWQPYETFQNDPRNLDMTREVEIRRKYESTFGNAKNNRDNPLYPTDESGVGPMQLTTLEYKQWADQYGWNGKPNSDELAGGRWNPDSNIRASARALVAKLAGVDPSNADNIWIGVRAYNGKGADADAYMRAVKREYDTTFGSIAAGAVTSSSKVAVGTQTTIPIPGHGNLTVPDNTPQEIRKAINFCIRRLGDPYQWGGTGPYYDCSSLVTAAYAAVSPTLRAQLDEPRPGNHGENTYTLFRPGRFTAVTRDNLKVGDLVFFDHVVQNPEWLPHPEHVGMYVGNGMMINDPRPGKTVSFASITDDYFAPRYIGARRLVAWSSDFNHRGD